MCHAIELLAKHLRHPRHCGCGLTPLPPQSETFGLGIDFAVLVAFLVLTHDTTAPQERDSLAGTSHAAMASPATRPPREDLGAWRRSALGHGGVGMSAPNLLAIHGGERHSSETGGRSEDGESSWERDVQDAMSECLDMSARWMDLRQHRLKAASFALQQAQSLASIARRAHAPLESSPAPPSNPADALDTASSRARRRGQGEPTPTGQARFFECKFKKPGQLDTRKGSLHVLGDKLVMSWKQTLTGVDRRHEISARNMLGAELVTKGQVP